MANPATVVIDPTMLTGIVAGNYSFGNVLAGLDTGVILYGQLSWLIVGASAIPMRLTIYTGTAAVPITTIMAIMLPVINEQSPTYDFNTPFPSGIIIPSGQTHLWVNTFNCDTVYVQANLTVMGP
jgi:hypothetical protein